MTKVATQEGFVDLDRLQDAVPDDDYGGDGGKIDAVREDIHDAVGQLKRRDDYNAAEDHYTRAVLASGGRPADALPQTQQFITGAMYGNAVQAGLDLQDHYRSLPEPALYREPEKAPEFDESVPEWKQLQETIRWSQREEQRKLDAAAARNAARPAFDAFKQQFGDAAPRMLNRTVDLHRDMSLDPDGVAPRLPLEFIGAGHELAREAAGMQGAHAEIEQFWERYPGARKYQNQMAALLSPPNGGPPVVNTLEEAAAWVQGWRPGGRHSVSSEGHRNDLEKDVRASRASLPDQVETRHRRIYSDTEKDVMKAIKQLQGE